MLSVGNGHVKYFFFFTFVEQEWYTIVYNSIEMCIVRFNFIWNSSNFIKHSYLIRVLSSHQSLKITWNSIDFYSSRFHQDRKTTVPIHFPIRIQE